MSKLAAIVLVKIGRDCGANTLDWFEENSNRGFGELRASLKKMLQNLGNSDEGKEFWVDLTKIYDEEKKLILNGIQAKTLLQKILGVSRIKLEHCISFWNNNFPLIGEPRKIQ